MLWLTACGGDRLAEPIMEQDAIRQVRQRIVQGLVVEARLGGPRLFEEAHLFDRRGGVPNEQLHDLEVARGKRRIRAAGDIEDTHGPALDRHRDDHEMLAGDACARRINAARIALGVVQQFTEV